VGLLDLFHIHTPFEVAKIVIAAISGWITAVRCRRRARRALGRDVDDMELLSLYTWMEITDREEQHRRAALT